MKVESVLYMLWVEDMDRAVKFYKDVMGLNVKSQHSEWSELTFGDAVVALHGGGKGVYQKTGLNFRVDNLKEACDAATSGGGSIVNPPMKIEEESLQRAEIVDTEGNALTLFEYVG